MPPLRFRPFPMPHFLRHQVSIVQSAIEVLATLDVDLGFRDVQPITVFGCGPTLLDIVF